MPKNNDPSKDIASTRPTAYDLVKNVQRLSQLLKSRSHMIASMADQLVQGMDTFGEILEELLRKAEIVKQANTVEPPLNKPDLADLLERLEATLFGSVDSTDQRKRVHAVIETVVRDKFNSLLVSIYLKATIMESTF